MRRASWLLAASAWLAVATGEATARERARFALELGTATVDGPGEGLLSIKDKAVRDIDDGDSRFLALRWNATERWYLKGSIARTTVRYASPLDPFCPLSSEAIGGGRAFGFGQVCQVEVADRLDGQIDEQLLAHELMVGHRLPLTAHWSLDAAVGVGRLRWESQDDIEAYDTSLCRNQFSRISPLSLPPVAGCRPVTPQSRETGAIAGLNVIYAITPRATLSVGGRFQDYRHLIWRSDVVNRFRDTNCSRAPGCNTTNRRRFAELEQGAWHWYSGMLDYAVTDRWHAVLRYDGGGNRDWDVASVAVRYVW